MSARTPGSAPEPAYRGGTGLPPAMPTVRRLPRLLAAVTPFLLLSLAGLVHLFLALPSVSTGLLAAGLAAMAYLVHAARTERRAAHLIGQAQAASRAEIENLADRMWELQESEERF